MIRPLLFLLSGFFALNASAQYRQMQPAVQSQHRLAAVTGNKSANKTTTGGHRWFNYARDYIDTAEQTITGGANYITGRTVPMWQDTNLIVQGPTATWNVNLVSVGDIFDPMAYSFNDTFFFPSLLSVTPLNTYTIDSVTISGKYRFNPAKTTVVDTLRLSFVHGAGGSETTDDIFSGRTFTSSHYGTVSFYDMHYDSIRNYARHDTTWGTPSDNVKDIILTSANWGDTLADGSMLLKIELPTPLTLTGERAGLSMSFISGDPSIPSSAPFDTLTRADGTYKYNVFEPMIDIVFNDIQAQWAPLFAMDNNAGYYKVQPTWANGWSKAYLSQFTFNINEGHYIYQYPDISWRVGCPACRLMPPTTAVNNVQTEINVHAYPNPANDELNIPFNLTRSAPVKIWIYNMLGQQVATCDMGITSAGTATINTRSLPEGIYLCTVSAGDARSTSKITITH